MSTSIRNIDGKYRWIKSKTVCTRLCVWVYNERFNCGQVGDIFVNVYGFIYYTKWFPFSP